MTAQGIHVLIVEDNPAAREGYRQLLAVWGFETRTAHNGLAALVEIRCVRPDIVLTDLEMPGMNGYELLTILRRIYPAIRLIAMSGSCSGYEIPPGVLADAFYPKGCGSFEHLREMLNAAAAAASQHPATRPEFSSLQSI